MKTKTKNIIILIILLFLTIFYFVTAIKIFNPHTGFEYKLYYLDKSLIKYVPDGGLEIHNNQEYLLNENSYKYLSKDFTLEKEYVSLKTSGSVYFSSKAVNRIILNFVSLPSIETVTVNGTPYGFSFEGNSLIIENIGTEDEIELFIKGGGIKLHSFIVG